MTRDMQIGLLLAVGFLALVGGVLYYRIEHPDELERFWNGSGEVAQTKSPNGQDADTPQTDKPTDPNQTLPNAPAAAVPAFDLSSGTSAPAPAPVQLADARGTPSTNPPAVDTGNKTPVNLDVNPPLLENKPSETPTPSTTNADLAKKEPPAPSLPMMTAQPPSLSEKSSDTNAKTAPQPALTAFPDLNPQPKSDKPASAPNSNTGSLPEPPSGGPPSLNLSTPTPPAPGQPSTTEKPKDDKSIWLNDADKAKTADSAAKNNSPPAGTPPAPSPGATPSLNDIAKSASPPITPAPAPALTEKTNTSLPNETPKNVPDPNSSPLWLDVQPEKDSSQPKTAPLPSPPDVTPPSGSDFSGGTNQNRNNGQYREYPAPRAGLGRPVPESVLAMNERRWSDSSNIATPIIPSSNDVRTGNDINVTNPPAPEKRIINDTTISSIRVAQGETFSSLSQRAYGSEMYAEALAAYNHEAGMVDADQPSGNQTVLIPAKFDLENRFGNLLRKQPFRSAATKATTNSPVNREVLRPTTATDGPTYRVRKGEQLFDVAKLTLGDGYRWGEIYSLNKDVLHESTELRPDMMLHLPADAKLDNGKPR